MTNSSKADRIGDLLRGVAFRELELIDDQILVHDYMPGPLADQQRASKEASQQSEQHILRHHGVSSEEGQNVHDEWCFECTKAFLSAMIGTDSTEYLVQAAHQMNMIETLGKQESAVSLAMIVLRSIDENISKAMRDATHAVRHRESFAMPEAEAALKGWNSDSDRVTDFYAERIGSDFAGMVDRAEQLSPITTKADVPTVVRRYLIEASRCYIFGQFVACLAVCRAAIEFALGDFLESNGQGAKLTKLGREKRDGLLGRIDLCQRFSKWNLDGRLDASLAHAERIRVRANTALHKADSALGSDECKELFFTAREVLRGLYS